jgi:membrane protein YdbS with pleckstrin-like domain
VPQPPAPKENLADAPATVIRAGRSIAVSRYLFDTEKFCGEWRRHWIHLWVEILAVTLGTFLLGYLAGSVGLDNDTLLGVFFVAWLALLFWAGWRVADWWYDRFVLTNRRVMVVSGLITRKVAMMPLQRVTDMAYVQGALGRVLDFGTFVLESAGQDQALREIKHLPRPNDLYLRMCEEMYDVEDEKRPASGQDSTEAD